jgi:hypothetical protein
VVVYLNQIFIPIIQIILGFADYTVDVNILGPRVNKQVNTSE